MKRRHDNYDNDEGVETITGTVPVLSQTNQNERHVIFFYYGLIFTYLRMYISTVYLLSFFVRLFYVFLRM